MVDAIVTSNQQNREQDEIRPLHHKKGWCTSVFSGESRDVQFRSLISVFPPGMQPELPSEAQSTVGCSCMRTSVHMLPRPDGHPLDERALA